MMTVQELIKKLESQLETLKSTNGFRVHAFELYSGKYEAEKAEVPLVRYETNTGSYGYCRSETCNCNSHDPWTQTDTVFVLCKKIGEDEDGRDVYALSDGSLFYYYVDRDTGHYNPILKIGRP